MEFSEEKEELIPPSFLMGGHKQTILGSLTSIHFAPRSETKYVKLEDEDLLAMEVTTPTKWKSFDPTIVLLHGLCGSHKSNYLKRLAKKFMKKGIRTIRLNLRGCGSGKGLAKEIYHCGCSDDVYQAIEQIKDQTPHSPTTLIGFSLGGNIVLKLAGEKGDELSALIDQVIAVSPPADLKSCVRLMSETANGMYEKYFINLLRGDVNYRHFRFNLPKVDIPFNMTMYEFDEYYVAPQAGYKCAYEYYEKCSAKNHLHNISVPCRILFAKDDPIIDCSKVSDKKLPSNVRILKTAHGGHLGFLGSPFGKGGFRWMDYILLKWIASDKGEAA